ncbi:MULTISPECIES: cellulose binding domain-containing protein [unclassified Micromonospora]|uniref:cellulose binding domain-containing protein n=1 Tax=unclassified Micromonospora TaxID=2617518 RepID=UPI003A8B6B40
MRKLLGFVAALAIGVYATLFFAPSAQATTATFTQTSSWSSGYVAEIVVTNDFTVPITGWEVAFTLPAGSTISSAWSTQVATTTPHYTLINTSWNGSLAPGQSVAIGFVVTGTGLPTILWPL